MAKKIAPTPAVLSIGEVVLNNLNTTGLTVVSMTKDDLVKQIPNQYTTSVSHEGVTNVCGFEMAPAMDDATANKRQLVLVYDEQEFKVDLSGVRIPAGKPYVCIKLFDRVANLTTLDPKQIKISPTYVTRMNYRIPKDDQTVEIITKNVIVNVMSFRKLIDDPSLV